MSDQANFFDKADVKEILNSMGYENEDIHVQEKPINVLVELGKNFIEEILDPFSYKRTELQVEDIKKVIRMKFPQLSQRKFTRPTQILQKRFQEIDKVDERLSHFQ